MKKRRTERAEETTQMDHAFDVHTPTPVHPSKLNDAVYNPNEMTPQEFEALKESIREHGFSGVITVRKEGMMIIGGHHNVRAMKELAIEANTPIPMVPCNVLDISAQAAKKLNVKLNHIHGSPNAHKLGELLIDVFDENERIVEEDVTPLGLEYDDALKYIRTVEPDYQIDTSEVASGREVKEFGRSITLSLEFNSVKARDQVKKILLERAEVQKKKIGDVVAELLARKPKKAKSKARKAA